ncbi:hypothetical protein CANTEDRAFT_134955 [Yamadazyma tenuis ATCC 10573]|uniref:Uncharacterized protein n=2 Tax=Candida tenuis TaxID=2315449 RepID=G3B526_CANTC|nr:uncharacterized protein CANTEDRAFT_134955 [Yamadazyma tenuis ATCC 10573]EGV63119.1 hypothetical protein CANTEDRAFT_134955 [Yamadazyma tenuis ATCC 10573]
MLLYSINQQLQGWRDINDTVKNQHPIHSVIVVPNNSLLLKYRDWASELISEIDKDCCPIKVDVSESGKEIIVRESLNIQFIESSKRFLNMSTNFSIDPLSPNFKPQIVIINSATFNKIFHNKKDIPGLPTKEAFADVKFVGIDEANFLFGASLASDMNPNIVVVGEKERLELYLHQSLKKLREIQYNTFKSRVEADTRCKFCPIQYCFMFHAQHPFHTSYVQMINGYKNLDKYNDPEAELVEKLTQMTNEEFALFRRELPLESVGELVRQHFYKKDENGNVVKRINLSLVDATRVPPKTRTLGYQSLKQFEDFPEREAFMDEFKVYAKEYNHQGNNVFKAYFKDKLMVDETRRSTINDAHFVHRSILQFRKTFPDSKDPILFVMRPTSHFPSMVRKMKSLLKASKKEPIELSCYHKPRNITSNQTHMADENEPYIDNPEDFKNFFIKNPTTNLLVPSDEFPGLDITGVKNIIICGSANWPTLATVSWNSSMSEAQKKLVSGIEMPHTDLFYYHLSKLQMENDQDDRNILWIQDSFYLKKSSITKRVIKQDSKSFREMLLYNDIISLVNHVPPHID